MKKYKDKLTMQWNLFAYFIFFLMLMLAILWLFQIVFLGSFYRGIKKYAIEKTAEQVATSYMENKSLATMTDYALENEFHIRVVTNQGVLISESVGVPSVLIQTILSTQYEPLYDAAMSNGGRMYLSISNDDPYRTRNQSEYLTYVLIADHSTMVIIQALVEPVDATVSTLKIQLWVISFVLSGVALAFSWFVSRRLSKPIVTLNKEANTLGLSIYKEPFTAYGYKEVNELSETLNTAHQTLSTLDKTRQEFLANVSHDLKTPLTMIQGFSELMRDVPDENTSENAQVIIDEARHLSMLVDDLLDLSKLQEGMDTLQLESLNLKALTNDVVSRYNNFLKENNTTIRVEIDESVWVSANHLKIQQVLYNLINNAIQYGGDGVSVIVRAETTKKYVKVSVIDNGPGIEESMLSTIWDRYTRSNTDHTRTVIGSGIGLSIVKHVLQLHGAPYGVKSKIGEGSEFWFKLMQVEKEKKL